MQKKCILPRQSSSLCDWSCGTNDSKDNGVNGTDIIDYEMQGEIVMMALNRAITLHYDNISPNKLPLSRVSAEMMTTFDYMRVALLYITHSSDRL